MVSSQCISLSLRIFSPRGPFYIFYPTPHNIHRNGILFFSLHECFLYVSVYSVHNCRAKTHKFLYLVMVSRLLGQSPRCIWVTCLLRQSWRPNSTSVWRSMASIHEAFRIKLNKNYHYFQYSLLLSVKLKYRVYHN